MSEESFSTALEAWLTELAAGRGISEHTSTAYRRDLLDYYTFIREYHGEELSIKAISALSPRDLRAFLADALTNGSGAATRNRKLSAIKSFYRYLQTQYGYENPALLMTKGPKKPERLPRPLSMKQAEDVMEEVSLIDERPWVQARDTALITLLYATGLRISEALSITLSQTPLSQSLRIKGKGNKVRQVPILPVAREAVNHYLELLPYRLESGDPIFRGIRGGVFSPRQAAALMQLLRERLGLPSGATPHALRHSFASHLLAEGGDIRAIQELLGHASLSTTQVYTKIDETKLLDAYRHAHPKGKG